MTFYPRREAIAAALFELVNAAAGKVVDLRTSSRRLRSFDTVDTAEMPALFQVQRPEQQERGTIGLPAKRVMKFELWLYTGDPQQDTVVPAQQLNNMVDAVEDALAPNSITGVITLNGLVRYVRIDGVVEYYENVVDGKSIVVIPVAVLLP